MVLNNQRQTKSRKAVYEAYLGNVIKMVNVNARWVLATKNVAQALALNVK
ncbi:MAG: hypothetical protein IBX69_13145 [Anaerolineales bacterium]|nr:hypothetical protein [Anaerolineales bacterium]